MLHPVAGDGFVCSLDRKSRVYIDVTVLVYLCVEKAESERNRCSSYALLHLFKHMYMKALNEIRKQQL